MASKELLYTEAIVLVEVVVTSCYVNLRHVSQSSQHPIFVPGVWGPYCSAMLPGYYLNEGGQTTTGQLVGGCEG